MANVNINEIPIIDSVDISDEDSLIIYDIQRDGEGTIVSKETSRITLAQLNNYISIDVSSISISASQITDFTEEVRAQFTAGTDITIVDGVISSTAEGGASTPGGQDKSVQFNKNTSLSGSALLTYDYDTNILSGTTAQFTSVTADGTNLTNLAIGEAEDGDYTDGLFTTFTSATKVGHAIDKINEVLKGVAPGEAPALTNLERSTSGGTSMKLSFGASEELAGYIDVTASLDGLSNVDATETFSVTNGSGGRPIRLGVFVSTQTLTFTLNNTTSEDSDLYVNYPADSFNVPTDGVGSFTLEVNGADVTPTGSTTDTSAYSANNFSLSLANTASFVSSGRSFDTFRHRTGTVSIPTSAWQNGHNYAKVTHVSSLGTQTTNYIDWIYDPASTNGGGQDYLFVGTAANNFSVTGQKNLSGVRYYTGCTFDFETEIYKYYRNTYPTTANGGVTFSGLTSGLTATSFASTPDFVSGYNDPLARSSAHSVGNVRILGSTLTSTMNVNNGLGKTASDTVTTDSILLDKVNSSNSTTVENFCLEDYRVPSASYDTQISLSSATFDSLSHLSASELAVYNGALRYPTQILNGGDVAGSGVDQLIAGQPDYSSATEDRYFFRRFQNGAGAKASFTFSITGQNIEFADYSEVLSGNKVQIWVKIPGKTGWRDLLTPAPSSTTGIATNDNVGCLQGDAPSDIGSSQVTRNLIVNLLTEGLVSSEYYVFRILTSDSWSGNISKLQIS